MMAVKYTWRVEYKFLEDNSWYDCAQVYFSKEEAILDCKHYMISRKERLFRVVELETHVKVIYD